MLSRIETAYLAILRIVVLVVATVALLVAIVTAGMSLPALARQFDLLPSEQPEGGTLAQYISERKATAPRDGKTKTVETQAASIAPEDVAKAATVLHQYSKGADGMTKALWEQEIVLSAGDVPRDEIKPYWRDTRLLIDQLSKARGKRLDVRGLKDLIAWNANEYRIKALGLNQTKVEETTAAMARMSVASMAFVLFILVIFTFLFVRVERSLRVVRTVRVGETAVA